MYIVIIIKYIYKFYMKLTYVKIKNTKKEINIQKYKEKYFYKKT